MKTRKISYKISLLLLFLLTFSTTLFATEIKEIYSCERAVNPTTTIQFKNKIGALTVECWDKNSVKVDIRCNIEGDADQVDKIMSYIKKLNFTQSGDVAQFTTKFWKSIMTNSTGNIFKSKGGTKTKITLENGEEVHLTRLELSFVLTMPKRNPLILEQAYENANLCDLEGKVQLDIYECNLVAGKLPMCQQIIAKYGDVKIDSVQNIEMKLYENKLNIRGAGDINANSKYSEVKINACKSVNLDSYEDKVEIRKHDDLTIKAKYSTLNLADFNKGTFDLYECKMNTGSSNAMVISAKYCTLSCISCQGLVFTTSYENQFSASRVIDLKATSSYSTYSVTQLNGSLNFPSSYEDKVNLTRVGKAFTSINLNGKYSNLELNFETGTAYKLDLDTRYTSFEYPKTSFKEIRYHKEEEEFQFVGVTLGDIELEAPLVTVKMYEGSMKIK